MITHGWNATAFDWVYDMAIDVCEHLGASEYYSDFQPNNFLLVCSAEGWDVWIVDWSTASSVSSAFLPQLAWVQARGAGWLTGYYLKNNYDYQHYHLIAHSAGSNLIDTATEILIQDATVHATFLDAYVPVGIIDVAVDVSRHISRYGEQATWVDNYVDTRNISGGGALFTVLGNTDLHLTYGFNVDVTPDDDGCDALGYVDGILCRHARPYRFYAKSINEMPPDPNPYMDPYGSDDPLGEPGDMGFARSMEAGGSMGFFEAGENLECRMQSDGSCTYEPWTPAVWTYFNEAFAETVVDDVVGTVDFIQDTSGRLYERIKLTTSSLFRGSISSNDEPAYMSVNVTTTGPTNILRFNWAFDVAGEGLLQVFANGELVHQIDQRLVVQGSAEIEEVYVGGTDGFLQPGTHQIAFRLDGFGTALSDVELTDVELGFQQVENQPDGDSDGIPDDIDNCTLVANADQRDTNNDGYGNACDPDLNNDGIVNFSDIALWVPFFNTAASGDEDFNGDGAVNFGDYSIFPGYFLQSPGPSGIAP